MDPDLGRDHQRRERVPGTRAPTTPGSTATLGFYLRVASDETTTGTAYDTLKVQVTPSGGATTTLATYSNPDKGTAYVARTGQATRPGVARSGRG